MLLTTYGNLKIANIQKWLHWQKWVLTLQNTLNSTVLGAKQSYKCLVKQINVKKKIVDHLQLKSNTKNGNKLKMLTYCKGHSDR